VTVYAYVGRPGAGKSYGVVENSILPACAMGRPVITNIPVYVDRITERYPDADITVVDWDWFTRDENLIGIPGGTLIVIDEVWRIFPAGQKLNTVSRDKSSFFAEHRHRVGRNGLSQDIVLIVQDLSKIAAWARADVDKTFVATKLDAAGMDNKFRVDIYQGGVKGPKYRAPDLGFTIQEYKPDVYQFYQSHTKGGGVAGLEIKPDKRATVASHPMVKYGIPLGIISIFLLGYLVVGFFTRHGHKKPAPQPEMTAPPLPSSSPSPGPAVVKPVSTAPVSEKPTYVPYSEEWRISGVSNMAGRLVVHLESKGRIRRIGPSSCTFSAEVECLVDGVRVSRFSGPSRDSGRTLAELSPFNK
jgi:zona occludens toxin